MPQFIRHCRINLCLAHLWKLEIALEKSFIKSKEIRGLPKLLLERVDNFKNNEQAISVLQKIAKLASIKAVFSVF